MAKRKPSLSRRKKAAHLDRRIKAKKAKLDILVRWYFLSRITRRSSTKYAILPACLASLNLPTCATRLCSVARAKSSEMKRPLGLLFLAFLRTASLCFQQRSLHTIVRGFPCWVSWLLRSRFLLSTRCARSISTSMPSCS